MRGRPRLRLSRHAVQRVAPSAHQRIARCRATLCSAPASARTMTSSAAPGESLEPRQTSSTGDYKPDPSRSLPLSPQRQALVDDVIALYSCRPSVDGVRRYATDCVYDDQFGYADDRYKTATQWFALPKLFAASDNVGYQVATNDQALLQFKNEQRWTPRLVPTSITVNTLVSLSLDPATVDGDFLQVKYHKEQANDKDYSHEGLGFHLKKWQADKTAEYLTAPELKAFEGDRKVAGSHEQRGESRGRAGTGS